jgi:hypothetical protein
MLRNVATESEGFEYFGFSLNRSKLSNASEESRLGRSSDPIIVEFDIH